VKITTSQEMHNTAQFWRIIYPPSSSTAVCGWASLGAGAFLDKKHQPTMREIFAAIDSKRPLWESLTEFIDDNYRASREFKFYGKNYGWALRYRRAGKALLSIYPGRERFTAQIVLGETEALKALALGVGKNVRKIIEEAHQFPEGRCLFIRVESKRDLNDVQQLVVFKSKPLKK